MTWQSDDPALYDKERAEVEAHFPSLRLVPEGELVFVRGGFPVIFEAQVLDSYTIEIKLARNHPSGLPVVREMGGRIPRHEDRHVNAADGSACVLLPDERWRLWPPGTPLLRYLTGPLHSFFLAQTMVEEGHPWPFGHWAHGAKGIFQYYRELLKLSDFRAIVLYLDYLSAKKLKGHWPCPCRNGRKLRDCHFEQVLDLREKISRKDAANSFEALKVAGRAAIEMSDPRPA